MWGSGQGNDIGDTFIDHLHVRHFTYIIPFSSSLAVASCVFLGMLLNNFVPQFPSL